MHMLTTAELRWFYPGKLPEIVLQWFEQDRLGYLAPVEEREDIYLYVPESEFVGIKLRQGRLEVKWRKAELGILEFGQAVGKAEKWSKWLCEDKSQESFQRSQVSGKQTWISVNKQRKQRNYTVTNQAVVAIPIEQFCDRVCSVELTQLEIYNHFWWSLAFEASGEDEFNTLKIVAESLFQFYSSPKLQLQDSFAYPWWLEKNVTSQQR